LWSADADLPPQSVVGLQSQTARSGDEFLGRQFAVGDRRSTRWIVGSPKWSPSCNHEMLGHFDEIYRRFERLEQEYQQRLGR
jgi:hypothetical protein